MHKPDSALEYETNKILWGFEIQAHLLNPAWKPGLVGALKKKEN